MDSDFDSRSAVLSALTLMRCPPNAVRVTAAGAVYSVVVYERQEDVTTVLPVNTTVAKIRCLSAASQLPALDLSRLFQPVDVILFQRLCLLLFQTRPRPQRKRQGQFHLALHQRHRLVLLHVQTLLMSICEGVHMHVE